MSEKLRGIVTADGVSVREAENGNIEVVSDDDDVTIYSWLAPALREFFRAEYDAEDAAEWGESS